MPVPGLTEIRLGAFKSHRDQTLQLEPMTLLVGRNGSGKSNALDALSLLALLADDRDVNDLERGDSEVAGLRGGLSGAAPFGGKEVAVGCTITADGGEQLRFDVTFDASVHPEITSERLVLLRPQKKDQTLIESNQRAPGSGIADVQVYSGGAPRTYQFLSSRLAVAQAVTRLPADTMARQLVIERCEALVGVLRGVFVLDPVPAQMREYVRIGSPPDRSGSSTSAVVYRLRENASTWDRLVKLVRGLVEAEVVDVTFSEAKLPDDRLIDVMVALEEQAGSGRFTAPARLMSDGTLRYLAIVASLLDLPSDGGGDWLSAGRTLVVEEIENGLFPSQSERVLKLLRTEAKERNVRLIATTHSPALLDALTPEDHRGVIVCARGPDGFSRLGRLTDHPSYVEIAGAGEIGRSVARGLLAQPAKPPPASVADLFAS
ncbi:MAG: AAA family ATPase [Actinobacteria bacterium]|nr:AAA family ATPase [Actinomycetota bacterium]